MQQNRSKNYNSDTMKFVAKERAMIVKIHSKLVIKLNRYINKTLFYLFNFL